MRYARCATPLVVAGAPPLGSSSVAMPPGGISTPSADTMPVSTTAPSASRTSLRTVVGW
jgi:hypothetical protein